jgi:uncharacterized caspase-like protein
MAEQFANGYALLIAVDENHVPGWALPDVAKDVDGLQKVLTHPERCGYPADNVRVLKGQDATRMNILDGLEWLQEQIAANDSGNATAVVYYTGHGWRDTGAEPAQFYFIPYDVRAGKIRSRALRAEDFAEAVGALRPRRLLVVLDCCHAGGMGAKDVLPLPDGYAKTAFMPAVLMAGEGIIAGPGAKGLDQLAAGKGRAVLSSSTGDQRSYMRPDGKMSIFTYHLIEALTGHARPEEGATEVLVSDMMGHVYRHVPESASKLRREQTPDYQVSGNFPVALLLGGTPWSKGLAPPDPLDEPSRREEPAQVRIDTGGGAYVGGGVSVQGGDFVGRDQITQGDRVEGDKVMGDKVEGDKISVSGVSGGSSVAAGRGAQATATTGLSGEDLDRLFRPLMDEIDSAPQENQEAARQMAEELEREVTKGGDADDHIMARLIDGIVDLVPGAVGTVTSMFATPILGGLAGSATKFVLDMIQRK